MMIESEVIVEKHESGCTEVRPGVYEVDVEKAREKAAKPADPESAHASAVAVMVHMHDRLEKILEMYKELKALNNEMFDCQTEDTVQQSKSIVAMKQVLLSSNLLAEDSQPGDSEALKMIRVLAQLVFGGYVDGVFPECCPMGSKVCSGAQFGTVKRLVLCTNQAILAAPALREKAIMFAWEKIVGLVEGCEVLNSPAIDR